MRQGSTAIIKAFLARKAKRLKNDATDGTTLTYHGNTIAWWHEDGSLSLTLAGWGTVTTRERLNTLCWLLHGTKPFHQKNHVQFFEGMEIDTSSVTTFHPIHDCLPLAA